MGSLATADLCDSNLESEMTGDLRVLSSIFHVYGQKRSFSGPITTVKVLEDFIPVRKVLETKGEGRVLVVDGGGSQRRAVVGGDMAQLAHKNGWSGIVVYGSIRDVDQINGCPIGVRALSSTPSRPYDKGVGEMNHPVCIAGHWVRDGEWLYADSDGIIVSKSKLSM